MDIGAVINQQYQVIEHIGRGGMADVWSARDNRLRRMVAIKTIAAGLGAELDSASLFKREAHTIAQLEHPHILPIYDFGEHDNSLYIVMRYMTAGSLEDVLREGPMSPDDVLRMGEAIGQALDYAHENQVIHLDLKPPNILLDSSKSPYLADFGLATALDPEGRARNPGSGTLLYMAPEQFLSDTLDHRADIYSFAIMLFHMLTGRLPFEGTVPLALQQIQRGEEMPYLDDYQSNLPIDLTTILRNGTAQDPNLRPSSHMDVMQQVREVLLPTGIAVSHQNLEWDDSVDSYNLPTEPYEGISDSDLLEAVDIYSRARYNWQGGQGRFLLGVTHFMLMSEYYQNAKQHSLTIDQQGYQMLLRGALEYDHELEYWWGKVNDEDRRWVCLHALRSGNTPARIRALYRLETLPDEEGTGLIPRLVAQALEVETDETAKIAALTVLGTRARLMKPRPKMQIMTEYRGRLITTMTRLGIEISTDSEWQEVVYSKDVDVLVAEEAFDNSPRIAQYAARTVGKMRSLAALQHISKEQEVGRAGALNALALVRDEAPSLPADVVNREARFYAWVTNTVRRLSENPLETMLRLGIVLLAGWIALGNQIFSLFRFTVGSVENARWSNTIALGLIFGLFFALAYLLSTEVSRRLKGFWAWWMRLLVAGLLAYFMGTLLISVHRYLFIGESINSIAWDQMRFAGAAIAFALLASQFLQIKAWQGIILATVVMFTPIFLTHEAYYFKQTSTIIPTAAIMLAVGVFSGWRIYEINRGRLMGNEKAKNGEVPNNSNAFGKIIPMLFAAILGIIWSAAAWLLFTALHTSLEAGTSFNWDVLLWISIANVLIGLTAAYLLKARWTFLFVALLSFIGIYAVISWQFFDYHYTVPFITPAFEVIYYEGTSLLPITEQPIFNFDRLDMIYHTTLPMVIVMALGIHFQDLIAAWGVWIGKARIPKERGAWLSISLLYTMLITGLISVLALFSAGHNRFWELGWSGAAFLTFIAAFATYRWTKWGANSLLVLGFLSILGGLAYDIFIMLSEINNQFLGYARLLEPVTLDFFGTSFNAPQLSFWALYLVVLAAFVWGALRRALWGGIGIVVMIVAWFMIAIASPLQGSMTAFAVANFSLVAYALLSKYHLMESGRWSFTSTTTSPSQSPSSASPSLAMETQIFAPDSNVPVQAVSIPSIQAMPDIADSKAVPATQKFDTEQFSQAKPEMLTELDPQSNIQADKPDNNEMQTAPQIKLDTSALRTQPPKIVIDDEDIQTEPKAEKPQIKLDTSAVRNTPASPEPPKLRIDTSNIRNPKTVRFDDTPAPNGEEDNEE